MSKVMTNEEYENLRAHETAFTNALKESNKWAILAKPIQEKQISHMLNGSIATLSPSEQLVMQSAKIATDKLRQAMEQYMASIV